MKTYTIEDLAKGNVYLHYTNKTPENLERLRKIIKKAFPKGTNKPDGSSDLYGKYFQQPSNWNGYDKEVLSSKGIKVNIIEMEDFITPPEETITITREALAEIYPNICGTYQQKVRNILSENFLHNKVEVPKSEVEEAYKAASNETQRDWFRKYNLTPKRKVAKEVHVVMSVDRSGFGTQYMQYNSEEKAISIAQSMNNMPFLDVTAIPLKGTYEVEEPI